MVPGRYLDQSIAQAADNDLTWPDSSSEQTAEFAMATSSPSETASEQEPEVAFRLRSESHSLEYVFNMDRFHSFHLVSNSTYHILIIPLFLHVIYSYQTLETHKKAIRREIDSFERRGRWIKNNFHRIAIGHNLDTILALNDLLKHIQEFLEIYHVEQYRRK